MIIINGDITMRIIKSAAIDYGRDKSAFVQFYRALVWLVECAVKLSPDHKIVLRYLNSNISYSRICVWDHNNGITASMFHNLCSIYNISISYSDSVDLAREENYTDPIKAQDIRNLVTAANELDDAWVKLRIIILNLLREVSVNSELLTELSWADIAPKMFSLYTKCRSFTNLASLNNSKGHGLFDFITVLWKAY